MKSGYVYSGKESCEVTRIVLDTGATAGNYIGRNIITKNGWEEREMKRVDHTVTLGDSSTRMECKYMVKLGISLRDHNDQSHFFPDLEFYAIETMRDDVIIGEDKLTGDMYHYFLDALAAVREYRKERFYESASLN